MSTYAVTVTVSLDEAYLVIVNLEEGSEKDAQQIAYDHLLATGELKKKKDTVVQVELIDVTRPGAVYSLPLGE